MTELVGHLWGIFLMVVAFMCLTQGNILGSIILSFFIANVLFAIEEYKEGEIE